jgi:exosortase C (VPDSG-CTERM-specific)
MPSASPPASALTSKRLRYFLLVVVVLCLAFGRSLIEWIQLALRVDLHSHVILIPFISAYLIWLKRTSLPRTCSGFPSAGVIAAVLGLVALGAPAVLRAQGVELSPVAALDFKLGAMLLFVLWAGLTIFGLPLLKQLLFPVVFLVFMLPLPPAFENALELFSQRASAEATAIFFGLTGTPVFRDGQDFRLPGVSITVAQECSGIRSSYVLFLTSLLAGHLFLCSLWRRTFLTLFVIPLGIARNGFRIWILATLAYRFDPGWLDSPLHHRGGPVFFLLSLIPFFLVLFWLIRRDRRRAVPPDSGQTTPP